MSLEDLNEEDCLQRIVLKLSLIFWTRRKLARELSSRKERQEHPTPVQYRREYQSSNWSLLKQ